MKAAYTGIHPSLDTGEILSADVFVNGNDAGRFDYHAENPRIPRKPALEIILSEDVKTFRLKGKLASGAREAKFDRTWDIYDMGPYTKALYDRSLSLVERVQNLCKSLDEAAGASVGELYNPVDFTKLAEDSSVYVQKMEDRLQHSLPQAFYDLIQYKIAFYDEDRLADALSLKSITEEIPEWGFHTRDKTDRYHLDNVVSSEVRELFDNSVVAFFSVELMLAWSPVKVPGVNQSKEDGGVWFWIDQETFQTPYFLVDTDGQAKGAEAALTNIFQRALLDTLSSSYLENYNETYNKQAVLIDSSHPNAVLSIYFSEGRPEYWYLGYSNEQVMW